MSTRHSPSRLQFILPNDGEPPLWDETNGAYRANNVDVFYKVRPEGVRCPLCPSLFPQLCFLFQTNLTKARPFTACWTDEPVDEIEPTYAPQVCALVPSLSSPSPAQPMFAQTWVKVPLEAPLLLVLVQGGNVLPEFPVLHVVARGSSAWDAMKTESGGSFTTLKVPKLPPRPKE